MSILTAVATLAGLDGDDFSASGQHAKISMTEVTVPWHYCGMTENVEAKRDCNVTRWFAGLLDASGQRASERRLEFWRWSPTRFIRSCISTMNQSHSQVYQVAVKGHGFSRAS